jgi:selenide,water dikinase
MEQIKLTQTVQKGGCAAKIAALELRSILQQVKFPPTDENLLVDGGLFDDAAIYKVPKKLPNLGEGPYALVQTLDFFTPIVDSPYRFGAVAAANSLSDVYAMGGLPRTAMAILAFPLGMMPNSVIVEILQGASDKMKEAKVNFVGGHSIDDDTLKFGLSVTGFVEEQRVWSNAGAKPGDILILTKALGTGTAMASLKQEKKTESELSEVLASMEKLNNVVDFLNTEDRTAIHAATDITGFGLAGHAQQMAKASQGNGKAALQFQIQFKSLPIFPVARETLRLGCLTKAHRTNADYTRENLDLPESFAASEEAKFLFDPQTSGGLLLSVSPEQADGILRKLKEIFPATCKIGSVQALPAHQKILKVVV